MNIIEAYIKFKGQLLILISGISGSGVSQLSKTLSSDLKLAYITYKDYLIEPEKTAVTYQKNGSTTTLEITNWDTDDVIDWDKFLKAINNKKKDGVIVCSPSFPLKKINDMFVADMHFHIKLSKQNLLKRRLQHDKLHNPLEAMDEAELIMLFNKFTFPYYIYTTTESYKITKFINANEFVDRNLPKDEYDDKLATECFDSIIKIISTWLETNKPIKREETLPSSKREKNNNTNDNDDDSSSSGDSNSDEDSTEGYELELY